MAESVDALVSNTSGATRAGSTPALGTLKAKYLIIHLLSFFVFIGDVPKLSPIILMYSTKDGAFTSCYLLLLV